MTDYDSEPTTPPPVRRSMTTPPPAPRKISPVTEITSPHPQSRRRLFAETDTEGFFPLEITQTQGFVFRRQHRHRQIGKRNNNH